MKMESARTCVILLLITSFVIVAARALCDKPITFDDGDPNQQRIASIQLLQCLVDSQKDLVILQKEQIESNNKIIASNLDLQKRVTDTIKDQSPSFISRLLALVVELVVFVVSTKYFSQLIWYCLLYYNSSIRQFWFEIEVIRHNVQGIELQYRSAHELVRNYEPPLLFKMYKWLKRGPVEEFHECEV